MRADLSRARRQSPPQKAREKRGGRAFRLHMHRRKLRARAGARIHLVKADEVGRLGAPVKVKHPIRIPHLKAHGKPAAKRHLTRRGNNLRAKARTLQNGFKRKHLLA